MSYFDDVIEPALLRDPPSKRRKQTIIADDISDDKEFEWTTKDGRKYPVSLMTDEHLYNAFRHVRDRPAPEPADYLREDIQVLFAIKWQRSKERAIKAFQQEAERRGLGELF